MHWRFVKMNRHSAALPFLTRNHAQFTVSRPAVYQRFANLISDPSVARRLGSNAS
ncbi:hypothetical protein HAX54_005450, partial [Datura stramonium]|nr:hypothetical protein [Datura stramonium]